MSRFQWYRRWRGGVWTLWAAEDGRTKWLREASDWAHRMPGFTLKAGGLHVGYITCRVVRVENYCGATA